MSGVIELLEKGRARLMKGWCRGASARDATGEPVRPTDPAATHWCLIGALSSEAESYDTDVWSAAVECLKKPCLDYLVSWNDSYLRTQSEVIAHYNRAIALAAPGETP